MTDRTVRVAIRTLGCKVNRAESEAIAAELLGAGAIASDEDDAQVIVVNTCTVTGEADAKARKAVRHSLAAASGPVVVVTGCLATLDADGLRRLGERVVVEADKERVAARVVELLGMGAGDGRPDAASRGQRAADELGLPAAPRVFRTRVALKIEDGCDNRCTYCIVPDARGVPRATPLADILRRCEQLAESGTGEVVLTGINIGRYADPATDADLADVVKAAAATGIARVRLSSVEPPDLTPRLLEVMAAVPALCAHLHVPLQSGSDRVLSAMGRAYTATQFAAHIAAARAALPGLVVTTDVIAGFPGETDAEAAETLAFCQRMGFGKLHVFRYSERSGTPAAEMTDQVPARTRAARAVALRDLSERLEGAHAAAAIGREAEVLVERLDTSAGGGAGASVAVGTTRDYLRARFEAGCSSVGDLVRVRLLGVEDGAVLAERLC